MQEPGGRSRQAWGVDIMPPPMLGTGGDYSDLSWKAKFHCQCSKSRTVSSGNSHIKRSPLSLPVLSVLERSVLWAVGANLCLQQHIWAVPAADPEDMAQCRLRTCNPCL